MPRRDANTKSFGEIVDKRFFDSFSVHFHTLQDTTSTLVSTVTMGKIRQKKKNRSELPKARPKNRGVIKSGRKKVNVLGNAIIAENWLVNPPLLCIQNQCSQVWTATGIAIKLSPRTTVAWVWCTV